MTAVTVMPMESGQADDMEPPPGTAIVRPLRHVRTVRAHHGQRFASPAEAAASRSARAWAWALGETPIAPVTDRQTPVPPGRNEIEAEIAEADERRLRGAREGRADAAATILRWLIGDDDHVPVRAENPGELVGGFGPIVRSREQIADALAVAADRRSSAVAQMRNLDVSPDDRLHTQQTADYLDGVIATLNWVLGKGDAPITHTPGREVSSRDLKTERLHAEDSADQAQYPWVTDRLPPPAYGEAVEATSTWLLGESIVWPVDLHGSRSRGAQRADPADPEVRRGDRPNSGTP